MRRGIVFILLAVIPVGSALGSDLMKLQRHPVGDKEGLFAYRYEGGETPHNDLLSLVNGSKRIGKVLEWGNQILLFDAGGNETVFPIKEVDHFELRRGDKPRAKPALSDLTIAYVERLPRDTHWMGHIVTEGGLSRLDSPDAKSTSAKAGDKVTYRAHIFNAGGAKSFPATCKISIDGATISEAAVATLDPGQEQVVETTWQWQDGQHSLRVDVVPSEPVKEIAQWNNSFIEPTRALGITVVVAKSRYEQFRSLPNLVDTFCFEDFIQYHIRNLNALFSASIYPSTPQGILERVRCDRIVVVDDPQDQKQRASWSPSLQKGGQATGLAEYAALLELGNLSKDEDLKYDALKVDWKQLQNICRQLGLVDLNKTDTTPAQCYVFDQYNRYAVRSHLSPWIQTLMYTAGGFPLAEHEAAYLNATLGQPRGSQGEYLYNLPEKITLEVLSNTGAPLAGVQVDVFELQAEGEFPGTIRGIGESDPLSSAATGDDGRAPLVDQPAQPHTTPGGIPLKANPFGKIMSDGSNGLLLLRLRSKSAEEFFFLPISVCNLAYFRGHKAEYVHRLQTHFAGPEAPPSPMYAAAIFDNLEDAHPKLTVSWHYPDDIKVNQMRECRIYKRTGFGGDEARPWMLVNVVKNDEDVLLPTSPATYFDEFEYNGPYSLDTFIAVTLVDDQGRESDLSAPAYLAYEKDSVQFAIDTLSANITVRGDGPAQMLYWDGVAGTQPYGVKTDNFKGYKPAFEGVAYLPDHRLIVTDPVNHVLAVYEKQQLQELMPAVTTWPHAPSDKPGEFYDPSDLVLDEAGNMYVAERGNHRVQILDSTGKFKSFLDEDFRFRGPSAIGYSNGHIAVTDDGGKRCRLYDISADAPAKFVRQLTGLSDAGRAIVSKGGRIFITGRATQGATWGVLVYEVVDGNVTLSETRTEGVMGKFFRPRGLFLYRGADNAFAYFVNGFPFGVGRVGLEGGAQ